MASISLNNTIYLLFIVIIILIVSIFAFHMGAFKKEVEGATKKQGDCLENDNRKILTEEDCYYKYNGEPILNKFDNIPSNKVCCQLK